MSQILIFAGTTEGRELSEFLSSHNISHDVCVATDYGKQMMDQLQNCGMDSYCILHTGRKDAEEMQQLIQEQGVRTVIDATHPYAVEVSSNIRNASKECGIPCLRLSREANEKMKDNYTDLTRGLSDDLSGSLPTSYVKDTASLSTDAFSGFHPVSFPSADACREYLKSVPGNILLTTGSKDLPTYCADDELRKRLYVRVLPGKESISICEASKIPGKQIIAMQGPFSREMNLALIHQFAISCMVTKVSGKAGGFDEKIEAARQAGISVCLIQPEQAKESVWQYSLKEIEDILCEEYLDLQHNEETSCPMHTDLQGNEETSCPMHTDLQGNEETSCRKSTGLQLKKRQIFLIGIGMGQPEGMTIEASRALDQADIVFGAKRMLEDLHVTQENYPYYLGKDILPVLKENKNWNCAAILFSGDTGFCSGMKKMYQLLNSEEERENLAAEVRIFPGISSIASLAAATGESWDQAKIMSIHGKGDFHVWGSELLTAVRCNSRVFLIVSGVNDVRKIGELLRSHQLQECRLVLGYRMSYPEERIEEVTPEQCTEEKAEGLYTLLIRNPSPQPRMLTHGVKDTCFIRGKVPMTKEEVRTVSISRLGLWDGAVCYDIGSGTGSIAVEIARLSPHVKVYAVERKPEALELIRKNAENFGLYNIEVIASEAPDGLAELPAPTHVFLGGTGGHMKEILRAVFDKNPEAHVVANAVSFETLQEFFNLESEFDLEDFEITSLSAVRTKVLGHYHMMQGENPVWICSFKGRRIHSL